MIKQHTEQEILEILKEMEIEPDMVDIWEDRDGDISIEARGMAPAGEREFKMKQIGHVDNGIVWLDQTAGEHHEKINHYHYNNHYHAYYCIWILST